MASDRTRRSRRAGGEAARSLRERILEVALELMAERGVRGMGMRDLAAAAGCNVATLYYYFPSKRDLLAAVLADRGYLEELAGPPPVPPGTDPVATLAALLEQAWLAMVDLEDYVRLMLGEALRGEPLAREVGSELLERTEATLARWLGEAFGLPESRAAALARILRGVLVGAIVEYLTGIVGEGRDREALRRRARDVAAALGPFWVPGETWSGLPGGPGPLGERAEGARSRTGGASGEASPDRGAPGEGSPAEGAELRTPSPRRAASAGAARRRGSPGRS
jgi:AcrR family transcriptional regulator